MDIPLDDAGFASISNMGFINGELHIQTKVYPDNNHTSGELYLTNAQGEILSNYERSPGEVTLGKDLFGNMSQDFYYTERVYDVKGLNLEETFIGFGFITLENQIDGEWENTFKIQTVKDIKTVVREIDLETWIIDKISVSPMGVSLNGKSKKQNVTSTPVTFTVNMVDGSTETYEGFTAPDESKGVGFITAGFMPSLPLEVAKVKSITINETTVDF